MPAISQDKIDKIVEMYNAGHSLGKIRETLGVGDGTAHKYVSMHCKMRGVHEAATKQCWHEAFSVTSEDSAYWTGFLMADGNVSRPKENCTQRVSVMLSNCDYSHIQKLLDYVCSDAKISVVKSGGFKKESGVSGRGNLLASVKIASNQICKDLEKCGVVPNKTYTATASDSIRFNKHFWRGCIDGDGTLMTGHSGRINPSVRLYGTPALIAQFGEFVKSLTGHEIGVQDRGVIFAGTLTGEKAIDLVRHLYADCTVALDRKLDIALAVLSLNYKADFRNRRKNMHAPDGKAWCGMCESYKAVSEFSKAKARANGLSPRCRSCASEKAQAYHLRVREVKNKKRMERYYRERNLKKWPL